jgi:hypothetical protein
VSEPGADGVNVNARAQKMHSSGSAGSCVGLPAY